jgi:hypothetical protein
MLQLKQPESKPNPDTIALVYHKRLFSVGTVAYCHYVSEAVTCQNQFFPLPTLPAVVNVNVKHLVSPVNDHHHVA